MITDKVLKSFLLGYKGVHVCIVPCHQQKEGNVVSMTVMCLWPPCATALKFESSSVSVLAWDQIKEQRLTVNSSFSWLPVSYHRALHFASAFRPVTLLKQLPATL